MKQIAILLYLVFWIAIANANSLDIYILNPEHKISYKKINAYFDNNKKENRYAYIIDSRNGKIFFKGDYSSLERKIKSFYKRKKEKLNNNDVAYTLKSIYKTILPKEYNKYNLFFINSIFYNDNKYNFLDGTPNDAFITSKNSPFYYLPIFKNKKIDAYIFNNKKLFLDKAHNDGLSRYYYLLFKKLNINLITFNNNFSLKKEKFNIKEIDNSSNTKKLTIVKVPPKKIHFEEDEFVIKQKKDRLFVTIKNIDRKNMLMQIKLNNIPYSVLCDNYGVCKFEAYLKLGKNTLEFKKLNNKNFTKEIVSKYIPDDELHYYSIGEIFVLKVKNSYRPNNDIVKLKYTEENIELSKKVVNGYYEFRVKMKHPLNHFVFYQYSGNIDKIEAINEKLKKEEEKKRLERIRKLKEKKRQEELKKIEEEKKRKEREKKAQEKIRKEAINKGTNKVSGNTEILINNYSNYGSTKKEYKLALNSPRKIDKFEIAEFDADGDGFDVIIEDINGNKKTIANNVLGSGNDETKRHIIDNPYKNIEVSSITIKPKSDLGGMWRIKQALVKYIQ